MLCFSGIVSLNTDWTHRDLAKADITYQYVVIGINPNPIDIILSGVFNRNGF